MAKRYDEHMLQGLLASFGDVLPDWLKQELNAPPAPAATPALAALCRDAAKGDRILAAMADKLTAKMAPLTCSGRLRAQEVLLASAGGQRPARGPDNCALKAIGLAGPCSFRCQTDGDKQTLALWRDTIRYIKTNFTFSDGQEALAGITTSVQKTALARLPLERK
jgi:hypothetical protein